MSQYQQFVCKLKWRMYNNDRAFYYDVPLVSNSLVYQVRPDYDLRFFCSISSSKVQIKNLN
jgi:hypothetical protein